MNNGVMTVDKTSAAYQLKIIRSARYNLAVAVVFTVLNLVMLLVGSDSYFLFSSTISYYLTYFGYLFDLFTVSTYTLTGLMLGAIPLLAYGVFWLLSLKNDRWLLPAAVLFAVDTLALVGLILVTGDILGMILQIVFHGWVMFSLIRGVIAGVRLRKLPTEPEQSLEDLPAEPEEVLSEQE